MCSGLVGYVSCTKSKKSLMKNTILTIIIASISLLFTTEVLSQNNCDKQMSTIVNNGTLLNKVTPLSSTMIVSAHHYAYNKSGYVIAYLKSGGSSYNGRPYLFCGVSKTLWNQFTSNGLYNSYGEAFHEYILGRKCDCSSSKSYDNYGSINTAGIAYVLQEKQKRWDANEKKTTDYLTEGFAHIADQCNDIEKKKAMEYLEDGLEIYLSSSSTRKLDYSNSEHTRWALNQMDKIFSYIVDQLNNDNSSSMETRTENEEPQTKRKEILYKTHTVNVENLPIRSEPNYTSKILAKITKSDLVHVLDTIGIPNNYVRILSKNEIGYVNRGYLSPPLKKRTDMEIEYENLLENIGHYYTNNVKEYSWSETKKEWSLDLTDLENTEFKFGQNFFEFKRQAFPEWKKSTYIFNGIDEKTNSYLLQDFYGQKILISKNFQTISWFAEKHEDGYYSKLYQYNNLSKTP